MHTPSNYRRLHRVGVFRRNARATAACLPAFLAACASAPGGGPAEPPIAFAPAPAQVVSWEAARRNLAQALQPSTLPLFVRHPDVDVRFSRNRIRVTPSQITLRDSTTVITKREAPGGVTWDTTVVVVRHVAPLAEGDLVLQHRAPYWTAGIPTQIASGGFTVEAGVRKPFPDKTAPGVVYFSNRSQAEAFLQAWYDAKKAARDVVDPDVDFPQRAAIWRARNPKPPLSEAANRHRVLAEEATRARDYVRAIEEFEAALQTDPMWPSGNFNLALLYETVEEWDEAVRYMRRFLLLEPDSREASAARDKIIAWEDRARRALR